MHSSPLENGVPDFLIWPFHGWHLLNWLCCSSKKQHKGKCEKQQMNFILGFSETMSSRASYRVLLQWIQFLWGSDRRNDSSLSKVKWLIKKNHNADKFFSLAARNFMGQFAQMEQYWIAQHIFYVNPSHICLIFLSHFSLYIAFFTFKILLYYTGLDH